MANGYIRLLSANSQRLTTNSFIFMITISETRFRTICDDAYRDRHQIYAFDPNAGRAQTVLWVILGAIHSYLSLSDAEIAQLNGPKFTSYSDVICEMVQARQDGNFAPRPVLDDLITRIETESA